MTNKERLISLMGFAPDENAVQGSLIDAGISPDEQYDSSLTFDVKKCAIQLLYLLLSTPDTTNENQYGIKFDRNAVIKRIELLEAELGEQVQAIQPKITGRSVW